MDQERAALPKSFDIQPPIKAAPAYTGAFKTASLSSRQIQRTNYINIDGSEMQTRREVYLRQTPSSIQSNDKSISSTDKQPIAELSLQEYIHAAPMITPVSHKPQIGDGRPKKIRPKRGSKAGKKTAKPSKIKRTASVSLMAISGLGLMLVAGSFGWRFVTNKYDSLKKTVAISTSIETSSTIVEGATSPTKDPVNIKVLAAGEMTAYDIVNQLAQQDKTYSYTKYFDQVNTILGRGDIRFCSQEGPSGGKDLGVAGYPKFNAPKGLARDLNAAGCNLMSLATDHMNDKGAPAVAATLDYWNSLPNKLGVNGANKTANLRGVTYFEVKGVKFAFAAFAENPGDAAFITPFDESVVASMLKEARSQAEVVIVGAHWGTEDSESITANQEKWAKIFAANGADIVFGTGPHVLQPVEVLPGYKEGSKTFVWYSLGSFLTSQLKVEQRIGGIAAMNIERDAGGDITFNTSGFMPTYTHFDWTLAQKNAGSLKSRNNLKIYPLDQATDPLARSWLNTSVQQQTDRVKNVLSAKGIPVAILSSKDL